MGLKAFCYFFSVTSVFMQYNCQINMKLFVCVLVFSSLVIQCLSRN